jgi:hypothetical protein
MKDVFHSFYSLSDEEYATLWKDSLFVLDASFLCNLYRLPEKAQNELLVILSLLSDRLWVPYHSALEFQRNRPRVIVDQKKKFTEIRRIFDETQTGFKKGISELHLEKRHSLIDPIPLLAKFKTLFDSFEEELSEFEAKQLKISDPDSLLEKLDELLGSKIGSAPGSQEEIDSINKEGKARYARKMPPGYMDSTKRDDKEGSHFEYGGIVYERQYGDLIIWKQTLLEAKSREIVALVFLTNDVKEDWWWIVSGKKIGPRPELRDEICRIAGVTQFHIYNTEQFLRMSSKHLKVEVSEESIQAARDVLKFFKKRALPPQQIVENKMMDFANGLMDSDDRVVGVMAETNASGYMVDEYEVWSAEYLDDKQKIEFETRIWLSGEHDQDKPFCGEEIELIVSGMMKRSDHRWGIQSYKIESCEVN